jgi:hypothetical protein
LRFTVVADATSWVTDIGTTIGAATVGVMATGTRGHTTAIHTAARAGGGHLKAASGCATVAIAATATIEVVGITGAVDTDMGHTAVDGTSAER